MNYRIKIKVSSEENPEWFGPYMHIELYQPLFGEIDVLNVELTQSLDSGMFNGPTIVNIPESYNNAHFFGCAATVAAAAAVITIV